MSSSVRHMAAKRRRGYTSPRYNLQKGSVWRITGIFRLQLSKTELSAVVTPFFFLPGNRQIIVSMHIRIKFLLVLLLFQATNKVWRTDAGSVVLYSGS